MTSNSRSLPGSTGRTDHPAEQFQPSTSADIDHEEATGRYVAPSVIAETLSSTFGPNGLDKLLLDRSGTVIVTNTGSTVLEGLEIDAPMGRVLRNAIETQADRIGDGSTTMALLTGELLTAASDLIDAGLHPTSVINGYLTAGRLATDHICTSSTPASRNETELLTAVATTAITGRWDADAANQLAKIALDALRRVAFNPARLTLHAYPGGGVTDAEHVDGILIDSDVSSTDIGADTQGTGHELPRTLLDPSIALVDGKISLQEPQRPATVSVTSVDELEELRDRERRMSDSLIDSVLAAGADVVVCQQAIDDEIRTTLAHHGVMPIERARRDEFDAIARATGAETVTKATDLSTDALGAAGEIRRRTFGTTPVLMLTDLPHETHASVVLRGGTEHAAEETRRIVDNCTRNLRQAVHGGGIVPGGGAAWIAAAQQVTDHAPAVDDRSQFALTAFADAMEVVPRTLARNAGADPIEVVARLRTRHDAGSTDAGVGPSGSVQDMTAAGVVEPAAVVSGCLTTAVETTVTLLRIDDVLDADGTAPAVTDSHDHAHDHGQEHGQTDGHDHGGYPWALSH